MELNTQNDCYTLFKCIGATIVLIKLLNVVWQVLNKVIFKLKCRAGYGPWENLGKWAVVTGGTDGIGKAYAEELALKGFNLCIISRNDEKLRTVTEEIEKNNNVSTKAINVDFTGGPKIYKEIEETLLQLEGGIGVLVNNVGMSYKYAEYFHEVPNGFELMLNLIDSNITSCTLMMRLIIPMMKSKGIIINVSSLMAIFPMPMLTTYSACKAYVDQLSRITQYEYKDRGIIIQSVLPAYVSTNMSRRKLSIEIPTAKEYVRSAIQTVGIEDHTYGYLPHKIRGFVHEWMKANLPARFNLALSLFVMTKNKERYIRKLKKREMSKQATSQ